jgi:hypothetical protein
MKVDKKLVAIMTGCAIAIFVIVGNAIGLGNVQSPNIPKTSCATDIRAEITYDEQQAGFNSNLFKIPIAHCGPMNEEGTDMWATAQLVWNNGKIVWWTCRDRAKCDPDDAGMYAN